MHTRNKTGYLTVSDRLSSSLCLVWLTRERVWRLGYWWSQFDLNLNALSRQSHSSVLTCYFLLSIHGIAVNCYSKHTLIKVILSKLFPMLYDQWKLWSHWSWWIQLQLQFKERKYPLFFPFICIFQLCWNGSLYIFCLMLLCKTISGVFLLFISKCRSNAWGQEGLFIYYRSPFLPMNNNKKS